MNALKVAIAELALLGLTGCANPGLPVGIPPSDFGNAVNQNVASETVNPMAPVDKGPIAVNADRAALELDRYINDMVKPPANIGTGVQFGTNGSGSNGSGVGTGASGAAGGGGTSAAQ